MSSEYEVPNSQNKYTASFAIDANETTQLDLCDCCAATSLEPSTWWLDLGKPFLIQGLLFIGRSDCKL